VSGDPKRESSSNAKNGEPRRGLTRRNAVILCGGLVAVAGGLFGVTRAFRFPPDTSPEGAYMRITYNLNAGKSEMVFPYLEDAAQHACYSVISYRKKSLDLVLANYPEPERSTLVASYEPDASLTDGSLLWVKLAESRGYLTRLRRDTSGILRVEREGDRATIETVRGTRYSFRRRQNGMWGLSMFTAELVQESQRAARDFDLVEDAAKDYARAK
jgi:hypothetical protein